MVAIMLYVLKTMIWYLKTAFGQSEISFGDTVLDPSMGLGQGNGAASLGFLAVCTLMINVCRNLGNGVTFIVAWAQDAFTLSAFFTWMTQISFTWHSERLQMRIFCR